MDPSITMREYTCRQAIEGFHGNRSESSKGPPESANWLNCNVQQGEAGLLGPCQLKFQPQIQKHFQWEKKSTSQECSDTAPTSRGMQNFSAPKSENSTPAARSLRWP